MLGLLLVVAGTWAAHEIVTALAPDLDADLGWASAVVLGPVGGAWVVYGVGWASDGLGLVEVSIAAGTVVVVGAAARSATRAVRRRSPPRWFVVTAAAGFAGFGALAAYGVLTTDASGTVSAIGNAWADIPFHTAISTAFTHGDTYPPTYVIAAGEPLGYPFVVDLLTGALDAGGLDLRWAVVAVNAMVGGALLAGFATLARVLTGSLRVAVVSTLVVVLLGNLGVLAVPADIAEAGGFGAWLRDLPWDYTGDALGTSGRERLGSGVYLGNPMLMFAFPRRSGALGLATGVVAFALVSRAIQHDAPARVRTAAVAGLVVGTLPRVHAHTAIALVVVSAFWLCAELRGAQRRARLAPVVLAATVAVAVAAPQVASMLGPSSGFITWGWWGWTGEARAALVGLFAGDRSLWSAAWTAGLFWVLNAGFLLLLILPAIFAAPATLRRWWLGFAGLWVFANSVKTQPWEWDNSAYFVWWQLATVIIVSSLLVRAWERAGDLRVRLTVRMVVVVLGVALAAGGPLSLLRTLQDRVPLWHADEAAFAERVRTLTPKDALILTAPAHAHPVTALAGRHVVMGFPGWLFSQDLDPTRHQDAVRALFAGGAAAMRRFGVTHVVDGPLERAHVVQEGIRPTPGAAAGLRLLYEARPAGQRWRLLEVVAAG